MTRTQINAIRELHYNTVYVPKTMTAREMALTPHNLSKDGTHAVTVEPYVRYMWNEDRNLWIAG